jgi:hypothetical protein
MKTVLRSLMVVLGTVAFGTLLVPMASAGCADPFQGKGAHVSPQSWNGQTYFGPASLLQASDHDFDDPIVGMWQVKFIAKGNIGPGLPPDGAVIDNAYAQWHNDGTEIMNSSRPPITQSFCLGVWERVGFRHYMLNHFAISWDPATDSNNPQGPANIREDVILGRDGKTFRGTFTIDQYDQSGDLLVEIRGLLSAIRITPDTPASAVF